MGYVFYELHLNAPFYFPGHDYSESVVADHSDFVDKYWREPLGTSSGLDHHDYTVLAHCAWPEYEGYLHAHHVPPELEAL